MNEFNNIDIEFLAKMLSRKIVAERFLLYQEVNPGNKVYYSPQGDCLETWIMKNDSGDLEIKTHREWDGGYQEVTTILSKEDSMSNWVKMVARIQF